MTLTPDEAAVERVALRTLDEWHEDFGPVLWWYIKDGRVQEAPYVGSPLDLPSEVSVRIRGAVHGGGGGGDDGESMMIIPLKTGGWPGYHTHWQPLPAPPESRRAQGAGS